RSEPVNASVGRDGAVRRGRRRGGLAGPHPRLLCRAARELSDHGPRLCSVPGVKFRAPHGVCGRTCMKLFGSLAAVLLLAACGLSQTPAGSVSGKVQVVAAENFWGSIAAQVGGEHASVTSIIANPDTDPHDYDPTPQDARTIAQAKYVIVHGLGYDPWAGKLLNANPTAGRVVLTIGDL